MRQRQTGHIPRKSEKYCTVSSQTQHLARFPAFFFVVPSGHAFPHKIYCKLITTHSSIIHDRIRKHECYAIIHHRQHPFGPDSRNILHEPLAVAPRPCPRPPVSRPFFLFVFRSRTETLLGSTSQSGLPLLSHRVGCACLYEPCCLQRPHASHCCGARGKPLGFFDRWTYFEV